MRIAGSTIYLRSSFQRVFNGTLSRHCTAFSPARSRSLWTQLATAVFDPPFNQRLRKVNWSGADGLSQRLRCAAKVQCSNRMRLCRGQCGKVHEVCSHADCEVERVRDRQGFFQMGTSRGEVATLYRIQAQVSEICEYWSLVTKKITSKARTDG